MQINNYIVWQRSQLFRNYWLSWSFKIIGKTELSWAHLTSIFRFKKWSSICFYYTQTSLCLDFWQKLRWVMSHLQYYRPKPSSWSSVKRFFTVDWLLVISKKFSTVHSVFINNIKASTQQISHMCITHEDNFKTTLISTWFYQLK